MGEGGFSSKGGGERDVWVIFKLRKDIIFRVFCINVKINGG